MIKRISLIALAAALLMLFTACPGPESSDRGTITVPITSIGFTETSTAVMLVDGTLDLELSVSPDNYNTGITWSSSNPSVATLNNGTVTALAQGSTVIKAESAVDSSIFAERTIVVSTETVNMSGWDIFNQTSVDDDGSMDTSTVPDFVEGKLTIDDQIGELDSGGPENGTLFYYTTPLEGNFLIRARIKVTDTYSQNSSKRGATFAVWQLAGDPLTIDSSTLFSGIQIRTKNSGDRNGYSVKDGGIGTSSPKLSGADVPLSVELIYQVERGSVSGTTEAGAPYTNDAMILSIYTSNTVFDGTEEPIDSEEIYITSGPETDSTLLESGITNSSAMYAGLFVHYAEAEISNVYIESEGNQLFASPYADAAAVMVSQVTIDDSAQYNETSEYDYQNSQSTAETDTIDLDVEVLPSVADDTSVTWSSSNEDIATVDSEGVVSVIGNGKVTITATANDGTNFADTFAMNITADTVLISSVSISGDTTVQEGLTTQLSAFLLPADATDQTVSWSSDNTNIATVDTEGNVTGVAAGTANITATANDASGQSDTVEVTITAAVSTLFSWTAGTDAAFDATSAPVTVDGNTITYRGSSPAVSDSGIELGNNRFNIGTHYNDNGSAGGTELATSETVNVDDGEFNFTQAATVTIVYSESNEGTGFFCYVNNNTSSSSKSVLGGDSKISPDSALSASGGTTTFTIDPADFTDTSSLAEAFIQLRADSSTTVNITSIQISYN